MRRIQHADYSMIIIMSCDTHICNTRFFKYDWCTWWKFLQCIFILFEIWKIHVQCALIIMNIWESLERKLWLVISWRGGTNHYFHYSTLHCRHTYFCFLLYRNIYLDFEFLFGIVTLDTHRFSFLYIYFP